MYHQYIILDESINVEDNEKLRATVADYEVYITEIEEEKKQVEEKHHITEIEEEKKQVEEKHHKEKQLIIGELIKHSMY